MLRQIPILTLAATLAVSSVFAAQEVTTPPVGFITLTVKGTTANAGNDALSVLGLGMVNPVEFQGQVSSVTGSTLNFTGTPLTGLTYGPAYYVEVVQTGSSLEGAAVDIVSNTASTIVLAQPLTLAANESIVVRKHQTVTDVFGADTTLKLGTTDAVVVFDASTQSSTFYNYSTRSKTWSGGSGVIGPDEGVLVISKTAADASIKLVGSVRTNRASLSVFQGLNVIGNPFPAEIPIASINLEKTTADNFGIFDSATQSMSFYNYSSRSGVWTVPVGAPTAVPVGGAIFLTRANAAYAWTQVAPF